MNPAPHPYTEAGFLASWAEVRRRVLNVRAGEPWPDGWLMGEHWEAGVLVGLRPGSCSFRTGLTARARQRLGRLAPGRAIRRGMAVAMTEGWGQWRGTLHERASRARDVLVRPGDEEVGRVRSIEIMLCPELADLVEHLRVEVGQASLSLVQRTLLAEAFIQAVLPMAEAPTRGARMTGRSRR